MEDNHMRAAHLLALFAYIGCLRGPSTSAEPRPATKPTPPQAATVPKSAPPPERSASSDTVAAVPVLTHWIADSRNHTYYPVGCPAAARIPIAARLYYVNESSLHSAGFKKSDEC